MDFELSEEQRLLCNMVRNFAEKEVAPRAAELDEKGGFPWENFRKMADLGLFGIPYPEEYGGSGGDMVSYAIAVEEISRACGSTGITFAAQTSLACGPLYYFGTEEQKHDYLAPLASGEKVGGFGLTEPGPTQEAPRRAPSSTATSG